MDCIQDSILDEMEQYCIARFQKRCFIKNNSFISHENLLRLIKIKESTNKTLVSECFERVDHPANYLVEVICDECGELFKTNFTKTGLMDLLSNNIKNHCPECKQCLKQLQKEKDKQAALEREERCKKNTAIFIEIYLDPSKSWNDNIPPKKYFPKLRDAIRCVNKNVVADYIKTNLTYKEFLNTPYWKAIAQRKKDMANYKCELCSNNKNLNVHHKTYINHGNEICNLQDLIVLCSDCHSKFHDKTIN